MADRVSPRPLILVVDDERTLFPMYIDLFESEGWACACWGLPDTAAAVAELRPDLVLADLVIADDREAGRRFVEALAANPATAAVPVIVCSADVRQLREARAWMEAHACSYLEKPFEIDALIAEIVRCLRERPVGRSVPHAVVH